jgi:hypothetical protein
MMASDWQEMPTNLCFIRLRGNNIAPVAALRAFFSHNEGRGQVQPPNPKRMG